MINNGLTKEDFKVNELIKWCPGCGDHAVLAAIQSALPETTDEKEKVVFVSGIGCSSRLPYYINVYGFHSLHGRAIAVATGIKLANPELQVWVATGDGDSMAIGGNHLIHAIRRNINLNIIIFNNKVYSLTKGQYSPTTPKGTISKTAPEGTIENPFNLGELVIGAQGTFFARVVDNDLKMMKDVFIAAARHKGTSIVEVLQNCVIFNNLVHAAITGKEVRNENQIYLENGKPMIFGANKDKGLILNNGRLFVTKIGKSGVKEKDILVHNQSDPEETNHYQLIRMGLPGFPVAMGIIRAYQSDVYEELMQQQIDLSRKESKIKNLEELMNSGNVVQI